MDTKKIVIANKNANYEFIVTFNHLKKMDINKPLFFCQFEKLLTFF